MAPQPEMEQIQPPPPAAEKMARQKHAKDVAWMGPPPAAEELMATELPAGDEIQFIESASARTETVRSETLSTVSVQPAAPNPAYATKTSKNKRRQCPVCPFFGTHLQRHIASKHPDAYTSKTEQVSLVHRHDKLSRKQVRQFQCTYKRCGAIITRLGQHLSRVHKIQDARELPQVKANCLRLPVKSKPDALPPSKQRRVKKAKTGKKRPQHHTSVDSSTSSEESYIQSAGSTSEEHEHADTTKSGC